MKHWEFFTVIETEDDFDADRIRKEVGDRINTGEGMWTGAENAHCKYIGSSRASKCVVCEKEIDYPFPDHFPDITVLVCSKGCREELVGGLQ